MNILEAIASGKYDKSLDRIVQAVRDRQRDRIIDNIRVGSKVRFPRTSRPTYLRGRIGTVKEFRRTRILITLDHPETLPGRKFRSGIICRPESLELVEVPTA